MLRALLGAWISALLLGGSSRGKPRFLRRVPRRLQILRPVVDPEGAIARSLFFLLHAIFSVHKKAWGVVGLGGRGNVKTFAFRVIGRFYTKSTIFYTKSAIEKNKNFCLPCFCAFFCLRRLSRIQIL